MFIHPEIQKEEVLFSNSNTYGFNLIKFKTKRPGVVAYDGNGNKLDVNDWFPVFISEQELQSFDLRNERKVFRAILEESLKPK